MKKQNDKTIKITSFPLAAFLLSRGHRLLSLEETDNPKRKAFVLSGENTAGLISEFYNDEAINKFIQSERLLKSALHNDAYQ